MQQGWTDGRPGGGWRSRPARWPRSARLATLALTALIGLTLLGAALDEDHVEAQPTSTTPSTTAPARPFSSDVTTSPSTAPVTASTRGATTTTMLSTTVTTTEAPTTTWAGPPPAVPAGGFANCAAARAAGAAPVHVGEPGYAPRLDGDGDGIGCE